MEGGSLYTGWGRGAEGSWLQVRSGDEGSRMQTDTWKMVFKATDLDEVKERRGASKDTWKEPAELQEENQEPSKDAGRLSHECRRVPSNEA